MKARSRWLIAVGVVSLLVFGCRTVLQVPSKKMRSEKYVPNSGCDILDYPVASDLPESASNLGWVQVRQEEGETDEATLIRLRQEICKLGGNALSSAAWVRGESEVEPRILKANAWFVP